MAKNCFVLTFFKNLFVFYHEFILFLQEVKAKLKGRKSQRMKSYYVKRKNGKERKGFMKKNTIMWQQTKLWRWKNMVFNRFIHEYKRKNHKTSIKKVNAFRFMIKRYIKKFISFKKFLINSLYCALSKIRDTHRKVDELAKSYHDSILYNTAIEQLYGGSRYHSANHEEYGFDPSSVEYVPLQDLLKTFKANSNCAIKVLQSQTSIVKTDLKDSDDDSEELRRKCKYQKGRFCSDECVLPINWGTHLHQSLANLTRTDLTTVENLANLHFEISNFDKCSYCKSINEKECALGNACRDKLRLLRKLFPHFA